MSIEAEFLTLMPSTVTLYSNSSIDKYGKRAWSASGTDYRCRIEDDNKLLRTESGREVVITGRVYVYGVPASMTTDWKIVLPDGSSPVIHTVTVQNDQSGAHHAVIEFGRG